MCAIEFYGDVEFDGDWSDVTKVFLVRRDEYGSRHEEVIASVEHDDFVLQLLHWFRSAPKDITINALVVLFSEHADALAKWREEYG